MLPVVVFLGAGLGGLTRYALSGWVQQQAGSGFPWGTLVVNVTGSLVLALVYTMLEATRLAPSWRAFVGIGFLGGYTTLSTFSYETLRRLQDAQWHRATGYILASVGFSMAGALAGFGIGARILTRG